MSRVRWAALVLLVVAIPSATLGSTLTTLFLDDFEAETPNVLNSTLTHWDILAGSVDLLAGTNICADAGNPSNCVDLDGTDPAGGSIRTKASFALTTGSYRLLFDLAGSQRGLGGPGDTVTVEAGSYFAEDIMLLPETPFATFQRDFTVAAQGSLHLAFAHHGADQIGLLLDNVQLGRLDCTWPDPTPEVPEPATLLLVGSGLILTFWRRLRVKGVR